jgi:hypothetical protein
LRHGGELLSQSLDHLRHAAFALDEQLQQTQTRSISQGSKQPTGSVQRGGTRVRTLRGEVIRDITTMTMMRDVATPSFVISSTNEILAQPIHPVNSSIGLFHEKVK